MIQAIVNQEVNIKVDGEEINDIPVNIHGQISGDVFSYTPDGINIDSEFIEYINEILHEIDRLNEDGNLNIEEIEL